MEKLYTIQEVATKLNLSDKTLRRWEDAGRFSPSRTLGNQRRYTMEDLQILDAIKHGTINEQKDLLNIEQASRLCGVTPITISRWEDLGKIHPLITSGNTYYPRLKLIEKMTELKTQYRETTLEPYTPGVKGTHTPGVFNAQLITKPKVPDPQVETEPVAESSVLARSQGPVPVATGSDPEAERSVFKKNSRLQVEKGSLASERTDLVGTNLKPFLANILITLIIMFCYHLIFNQSPSLPANPGTGSVQGATSVNVFDPRLDDLVTKFQDHLASEMLKDARPATLTTINLDNTALIYGTAKLSKGKNQISITQEKITPTTPVTLTFTSDYAPAKKYWVTTDQGSFTLNTDFPVSEDSTFNYSFIASSSATTN